MARNPNDIPVPDPETGELVDTEENPTASLEHAVIELNSTVNKLTKIAEEQGNAIDLLLAEKAQNPSPSVVTEKINPVGDPLKALEVLAKIQDSSQKLASKQILDTLKLGAKMSELQVRGEIAEERVEDAEERANDAEERAEETEEIARALIAKIKEDAKEKAFDPKDIIENVQQAVELIRTGKLAT